MDVEFWKRILAHRSIILGYGWNDSWSLVLDHKGEQFILANPPKAYQNKSGDWLPNIYAEYRDAPAPSLGRWPDAGELTLSFAQFALSIPRPEVIIYRDCLTAKIRADGKSVDGALNDMLWGFLNSRDPVLYWIHGL